MIFGKFANNAIASNELRDAMKARAEQPLLMVEESTLRVGGGGIGLLDENLDDQFIVFQFSSKADGPTILDTSEVVSSKAGGIEKPDAIASVQLASFHVSKDEGIDKDTRATLRLDLGKDTNSTSKLDTVFWSIAAGMKLYNEVKGKPSDAKDLKTDFNDAFSKRPVEIPGGLGRLSFEVVKHKEPKWWQRIFSFLQSGTGQALTSAIGFPAITGTAINMLDQLLNRLEDDKPEILFQSRPMTLALTQKARDDFSAGVPSVSVGSITPGFCLLARGRDYQSLLELQPQYLGAYGLLKPKDMPLADFLGKPDLNPLNKLTYAVLRVGIGETKLDPTLDFGG